MNTVTHISTYTINNWTKENEMKLNDSKTKYMTINFCTSSQFQTRLYLGNKLLEQVNEATLLGVTITDDLRWHKTHIPLLKELTRVSQF